jgi:hypothetical protein
VTLVDSTRRGRFGILLVSLAVCGCERRAPGPDECSRHALRVVEALGVPLETPQVTEAYQSEISRCLTTPYDRRLVRCVEERGATRRCYQEFELRRRESRPDELPEG